MTKVYHTSGKPLDIIRREAKDFKEREGFKLSQAKDGVAVSYGHEDWQDLVESCLHFDTTDASDGLTIFYRDDGYDHFAFDLDYLTKMIDEGAFDGPEMPYLYTLRSVIDLDEGHFEFVMRLVDGDENRRVTENSVGHFFQNKADAEPSKWVDAIEAANLGQHGELIALLKLSGFFDVDPKKDLVESDHESLIRFKMRGKPQTVGKRLLFNDRTREPITEPIPDNGIRTFVNELSDGSVVISNGGDRDCNLIWAIVDRKSFDDLVVEMEEVLGDAAYTTYQGERWMFKKTLFNARRRPQNTLM